MSNSVPVTFKATSIVLKYESDDTALALIDIEVLRQTDKAVLVQVLDAAGNPTDLSDWLPLSMIGDRDKEDGTPGAQGQEQQILKETVFVVNAWFSQHETSHKLKDAYQEHGYKLPLSL